MTNQLRIAILGAGIMGSSTALLLARQGMHVTLFDAGQQPFCGASRWNEGKIHLGFIYSADPTLKTAKQVIPGGLVFGPIVEQLTGSSLAGVTTSAKDIFLHHKDSVVTPQAMWNYYNHVAEMVRKHPDAERYIADVSECRVEKLTSRELDGITDSKDITAGFRIPEHSVKTTWIADRFIDALSAEPLIEQRMNIRVKAVSPKSGNEIDGPWKVASRDDTHGPYDYVINSLWEGRIAIDLTAGLKPERDWSNRYRLSLFLRTTKPLEVPSAIIATGPFGDIKNYNNQDFYLSWYPAGLMVDSPDITPPAPSVLSASDETKVSQSILQKLAEFLPATHRLKEYIKTMQLRGGWVFASGQGKLSDPKSTLHRRSDFGIARKGTYISIDTGKYSTAPWLAGKVADMLAR